MNALRAQPPSCALRRHAGSPADLPGIDAWLERYPDEDDEEEPTHTLEDLERVYGTEPIRVGL